MQSFSQRRSWQQDPWELEAYSLLFDGTLPEASRPLYRGQPWDGTEATRTAQGLPVDSALPRAAWSCFLEQKHQLFCNASAHPTSAPSDESHASAAAPATSVPSPPASSSSEQAKPSRPARPVNTISSGAPSRQAASQAQPQPSSQHHASKPYVPDVTSSIQTTAALGGFQRARPDEEAAAGAASAQPASKKYGSKAASQVRPQKRRRQTAAQAPAKEPASAAAAFSTAANAQEAVSAAFERADALSHALHDKADVHVRKRSQQLRFADLPRAQRMPHLNSHQEKEMRVLAAGLQQPLHPTSGNQDDPVSALTELNSLRSLQGGPLVGPADRMRLQNLQGLMVHPGWHEVVPCKSTIVQVYAALERGDLDLPVSLTTGRNGSFTTLRQMATIPLSQQLDMFADASSKIFNAMHLKLSMGDMCDQAVMKLAGDASFMGCVFFQPRGSLHVHGTDYHNGRSHPGISIAPSQLKKALQLDGQQLRLARQVWKQTSEALVELEAKRGDILSHIYQIDAANMGWQGSHLHEAAKTASLLDKVAELSENAQVQQEVLRHGVRVLIWQICSPATLARLICSAWPAFPDLIATLQTIAAAD